MKSIFLLMGINLLGDSAAFGTDWICREAASVRNGNVLLVCGVGVAEKEQDARIEALRNATKEFKELCLQSDDCKNHESTVEPMRTDCEKVGGTYKCYRAFSYQITNKVSDSAFLKYQKQLLDEEIRLSEEKVQLMREVKEREEKLSELRKKIASGDVADKSRKPAQQKIKQGMLKSEVIAMLGEPSNVSAGVGISSGFFSANLGTYFSYQDKRFCNKYSYKVGSDDYGGIRGEFIRAGSCKVLFDGDDDDDGVLRLYNFNPDYVEK